MAKIMSAFDELKALLSEEFNKKSNNEKKTSTDNVNSQQVVENEDSIAKLSKHFMKSSKPTRLIEQDSLEPLNQKFVTIEQMNRHYSDFLAKIQTQLSSLGGGGEVNLRGLDDVATSTTGTNKFLTYNPSTRKFYFDYISAGAGFSLTDGVLGLNAGPMFELDETDTFQLKAGTADRIGGIKAGPGVAIDPDGTLFIDSSGVPFTFGDFTGLVGTYSSNTAYALLGSVNEDEDIVIASNGSGAVNIVGELNVFATNADVTDAIEGYEPILRVLGSGKVRMIVPAADTTAGAFEIVGNTAGASHPTNQTGVILHTTGQVDTVNRVYHDAVNNYPIIVGRRYNGTAGALENVKSGETILRIAGQASTGTDFETFGPAKINWIATEDQGPTNQGGKITIDVTANGTAAFGNAITAAEFTANGVISDVGFVGDLTGNADTVTNGVYTTDTGTVTNTMLTNSTISGVALGSDLADLTAGTYLTTDGTYNGSTARTFAVDATTAATADKVVARDSNGAIAATGTILATRQAGSFGAGQTITINMATDKYVHATITAETVTIAYTNITPGKEVLLFLTNSTGDDLAVNSGLSTTNCTNAKAVENVKKGGTSRFGAVSFGASTATMYGNWEK
jgi:hypothetical protein